MAGEKNTGAVELAMITAMCFALLRIAAAETTHTVGGATGWTIPSSPSFYSSWVSNQTFVVGDTLQFNFLTGQHTVAEVSEAAYDECNTGNTISLTIAGPAAITIDSAGTHYYICTVDQHCSFGQKLSVTATGSNSSTPVPEATPPPSPGTNVTPPSLSRYKRTTTPRKCPDHLSRANDRSCRGCRIVLQLRVHCCGFVVLG
ncbi:hypothetical protein Nepgr_032531 [Nepenthes gracilis]|uniref:Phytocyanin domain-containing protein n=1 Tax=Nepenthes gracilis TaxID=150966 RepID=A0AAD3Y643_NEPGR|nr:hypothetical protein Nepgr_032531 [Nepenthes gracilis]